jgi:hypothetical protein
MHQNLSITTIIDIKIEWDIESYNYKYENWMIWGIKRNTGH